jgi:hypothetical protein
MDRSPGSPKSKDKRHTEPRNASCFFRCSRTSVRRFFVPSGRSFDLCWDCTLWVALTANREHRARLGVNDGDHLPSKTAKELVIGLVPVCRQLTQFFELGLWQFNYDVKPNIRLTRPGKVASGVNVSGGHIQGRQSLWCRSGDSACDHERASKMKRQIGQIYKAKRHFLVPVLL